MRSLGGEVPNWGYAESVLVDGDRVVCTPGGSDGSIVALNKETGEVIWQSGGLTDSAHYSSVIAAEVHGERQYIQLFEKRLAGVSAADGSLRWQVDWPGRTAVIPTPVFHENHVYVTSGYDVGCMLVRIDPGNEVSQVYRNNIMENHHGGVVLLEGHIYGYSDSEGWTCQNFMTGAKVWSERGGLGKGPLTYADGRLYCLEENSGTMVLAGASTSGWEEHGRFKLEAQSDRRSPRGKIWTHPVISGGRLYLRDQEMISCYVLKP
jgi:outer membrane protein assembly factor BamB